MTLRYLTINHLEKPAGCFKNFGINRLYQHAPLLPLQQQRLNPEVLANSHAQAIF